MFWRDRAAASSGPNMLIRPSVHAAPRTPRNFAKRANIGTQTWPVDFRCLYPYGTPSDCRRDFTRTAWTLGSSPAVQGGGALGVKQGCSFFTYLGDGPLVARLYRERRVCMIALPNGGTACHRPARSGWPLRESPAICVDLQEAKTISDFLARVQRERGAAHDHKRFTISQLAPGSAPGVAVPGVPDFRRTEQREEISATNCDSPGSQMITTPIPRGFRIVEWY